MRYRGFNIVFTYADHISKFDPSNRVWGQAPGYYCEVFSEADDSLCNPLDNFELILGDRLQTLDEDEVEDWITKIADKEIDEWRCNEAVTTAERKNDLVGRLVSFLGESEQGAMLYDTLHEQIGMTDDEIRECGFRSLSEYFDKPSYAQTIAEWLVKVGTENTTSCNMIIGFEKVNERYGVNLYEDEFLCDEIVEQLYRHEAILDVVTDENTFDMNFGYLYCPHAEEHEELTM